MACLVRAVETQHPEWPWLKRLTQGNKVLCRFDSRNRIQVVTDVDSDWSYWRGVAKSDADIIAVERSEIVEPNKREDISTIVERHNPQALLDPVQRKALFGVHDEQFVTTLGNRNF